MEREPTIEQLRTLYYQCHLLTNIVFQPIHIVRLDERTGNLLIPAGHQETIEFEIAINGEIII